MANRSDEYARDERIRERYDVGAIEVVQDRTEFGARSLATDAAS